jgi:hypothetical protein
MNRLDVGTTSQDIMQRHPQRHLDSWRWWRSLDIMRYLPQIDSRCCWRNPINDVRHHLRRLDSWRRWLNPANGLVNGAQDFAKGGEEAPRQRRGTEELLPVGMGEGVNPILALLMGTVGAKPFGVAGTVHGGRHDAPVIGDEAAGGAHPAVVARRYPSILPWRRSLNRGFHASMSAVVSSSRHLLRARFGG